jgi:WD40 repeat protein
MDSHFCPLIIADDRSQNLSLIRSGGFASSIKNMVTPSTAMNYYSRFDCWSGIAWACDSRHAVVVDEYDKVEVFDTSNGLLIYTYPTTPVNALAWSPDGTRVASADNDGIVRVWQASEKRLC